MTDRTEGSSMMDEGCNSLLRSGTLPPSADQKDDDLHPNPTPSIEVAAEDNCENVEDNGTHELNLELDGDGDVSTSQRQQSPAPDGNQESPHPPAEAFHAEILG